MDCAYLQIFLLYILLFCIGLIRKNWVPPIIFLFFAPSIVCRALACKGSTGRFNPLLPANRCKDAQIGHIYRELYIYYYFVFVKNPPYKQQNTPKSAWKLERLFSFANLEFFKISSLQKEKFKDKWSILITVSFRIVGYEIALIDIEYF